MLPKWLLVTWWSMLMMIVALVTASSYVPALAASLASKMKTGAWAGAGCRLTRSKPGRNHHASGTGGEESTGTAFPSGSSACASARAEPSVSPSASLWVTVVSTGACSITSQIRGATAATSARGGASSAAGVVLLLLRLTQQLADAHAVGHTLIELEVEVRRETEV